MTTENREDEAQLRALIDERVKAIHDRDADRLMAHHAPEVLTFDALNPLRYVGAEKVRERSEQWLSWYSGPIGYEVRDLSITAGERVAFCHYLYRISGTMTNGKEVSMWLRSTICFRKLDGKWMITHEHTSVPFDAESGKASLDIEP
ncbi:MAG TPA: nuclear transport factor 2 family protein [Pyrinomonadaceae bacterium]|nr:nuclear transport factor 2 family protein [Pyrinomonadaceae bacterium]